MRFNRNCMGVAAAALLLSMAFLVACTQPTQLNMVQNQNFQASIVAAGQPTAINPTGESLIVITLSTTATTTLRQMTRQCEGIDANWNITPTGEGCFRNMMNGVSWSGVAPTDTQVLTATWQAFVNEPFHVQESNWNVLYTLIVTYGGDGPFYLAHGLVTSTLFWGALIMK